MIELKIRNIEKQFKIEPGKMNLLVLENPSNLYFILKMFQQNNTDIIILHDEDILKNEKYIFNIYDLINFDINDKKHLLAVYKQLNNESSNQVTELVNEINTKIINLMDIISFDLNQPTTFNDNLTLNSLLSLYSFKFNEEEQTFIEKFVSFIKSSQLINDYKLVVTYGISSLITQEDLEMLSKEFSYLGICLLNIEGYVPKLVFSDMIIIDKDLCEL